jgi:hypothetical protein
VNGLSGLFAAESGYTVNVCSDGPLYDQYKTADDAW